MVSCRLKLICSSQRHFRCSSYKVLVASVKDFAPVAVKILTNPGEMLATLPLNMVLQSRIKLNIQPEVKRDGIGAKTTIDCAVLTSWKGLTIDVPQRDLRIEELLKIVLIEWHPISLRLLNPYLFSAFSAASLVLLER